MQFTFLVIVLFIVVLIAIGTLASKNIGASADDYLLGGRGLKSLSIGISAAATGNSGFIMIGAVGLGYQFGISFVALPLAWLLGDLVFWSIFPHRLNKISRDKGLLTVPSFLAAGSSSYKNAIKFFAALLLIGVLGSYTASQFSAITKVTSFIGYDESLVVIGITVAVILGYSALGGFKSSVWTDLLQAFFMFLITTMVLFSVFYNNGGLVETIDHLRNIDSKLVDFFSGVPLGPSAWTVIGFFAGWASAALGFGLSQPQVVSRYFAGLNEKETKNAKWFYILFLQYTWIGMTLFGVVSRTALESVSDPELALLFYADQTYNFVVFSIVVVGILSAVISTLDSMFVSLGGIVSDDLFGESLLKTLGGKRYFRPTVVVIFAFIVAVISVSSSKTVFELSALAVTLLAATVAPAMAYVTIKREAKGAAVLGAMLSGLAIFLLWKVYGNGKMEFDSLLGFFAGIVMAYFIDNFNGLTIKSSGRGKPRC